MNRVDGKFLEVDGQRFLIRGVTYGTFAPDFSGAQFPFPLRVADDFSRMRAAGVNTVRTYTVPTQEVLDEASRQRLKMMVGVPWTQHVAFLQSRRSAAKVRREVTESVRRIAGHPALLLAALGNEIPAAIVRWHGQVRIERFLADLFESVRDAVPDLLLTYVNFPPTEYLELPFIDVCAFNVYLHREDDLRRYIARLQHVAGTRPLLLAEAGADSLREGEERQAALTAMQLRVSFAEGACGAIAFAWTDEWWRGGRDVTDWAFGLVNRENRSKPALEAVSRVFAQAPFGDIPWTAWPKVSVIVCAYNAEDTIDECLTSLGKLTYRPFEIIVVNDGSRDATGSRARQHHCRVIDIPNGGLSAARNVGLSAATGEIVAYTDADVRVDADWLTYLVQPFMTSDVVGSGGPNQVPADDPFVAQCVARSPGGPTHVLLNDRIAEHVPGCNMAFRRDALLAIGGFDPTYLRAGDDVDVCWRLQKQGWKIGFSPAALVWHRHRATAKAYWRQQIGYGEGEQLLRPHHPDKFSGADVLWRGTIYSPLPSVRAMLRPRVNTGPWGTSLFPSVYQTFGSPLAYAPQSVPWVVAVAILFAVSLGAAIAGSSSLAASLAVVALAGAATTAMRCIDYAFKSDVTWITEKGRAGFAARFRARRLIAWFHFIQPIARVIGRLRAIFATPPQAVKRRRALDNAYITRADFSRALRLLTLRHTETVYWSEQWISGESVLRKVLASLQGARATPLTEVDDGWQPAWDIRLKVCPGAWLVVRSLVEEHSGGKCLVRVSQRLKINPIVEGTAWALLVGSLVRAWMVPGAIGPAMTASFSMAAVLLWRVGSRAVRTAAAGSRAVDELASGGPMLRVAPERMFSSKRPG